MSVSVEDVVSVLALVASCVALAHSMMTAREQRLLQGRLLSIEARRDQRTADAKRRADVRASVHDRKLVLRNCGPAGATGIVVLIDGSPAGPENDVMIRHDGGGIVKELGPGGEAQYSIALHNLSPDNRQVVITWQDEVGANSWRSAIAWR